MISIYTRQSLDKKDSFSIEDQITACKRLVEDNDKEEVKIFRDKGRSGGDINRPAFQEMIKMVKNGLITKIIVYKIDRFSRNLLDFVNVMEILRKYDVKFASATEPIDTNTPMGIAMMSIIMVFAQMEREAIRKRVEDNYLERATRGTFTGGYPTYGFTNEKIKLNGKITSILVENPDEYEHAKNIFEMYLSGLSLSGVARKLNEENIPAPRGGNWESVKIARILRNPSYVKADVDIYNYYLNKECIILNDISDFTGEKGCFVYGKREQKKSSKFNQLENHKLGISLHDGFIESKDFLAIQYKLDKNKQVKNTGKGKYTWLSGLTKCGHCGYAMTVSRFKDYKYFICRGRTNYHVCDGHDKTIYVSDIEEYVEKELFERIRKTKKKIEIEQIPKFNKELNKVKIKLAKVDENITKLIDSLYDESSGDILKKHINQRIEKLDEEKTQLLQEFENLKKQELEEVQKHIFNPENFINDWLTKDIEGKKKIIIGIIKKVIINNESIDIEWKY